jgi:hypothetical protein
MVAHRIADAIILRLISKWLKVELGWHALVEGSDLSNLHWRSTPLIQVREMYAGIAGTSFDFIAKVCAASSPKAPGGA